MPKVGETWAGVRALTTTSDAADVAVAEDPDRALRALRMRIWQARTELAAAVPVNACLSDFRYLRLSDAVDRLVVEYMRRAQPRTPTERDRV